jgi:protein-arginine kinase activator protein McsA
MKLRVCTKCKESKDTTHFRKRSNNRTLRSWCIVCERVWNASRIAAKRFDPDVKRQMQLDARVASWGMTPYFYHILLQMQDYRCSICRIPYEHVREFAIDHCHKTEAIRGLLCMKCNTGIGLLSEDTRILGRAIQYLTRD